MQWMQGMCMCEMRHEMIMKWLWMQDVMCWIMEQVKMQGIVDCVNEQYEKTKMHEC